jgi:hypothetical protein
MTEEGSKTALFYFEVREGIVSSEVEDATLGTVRVTSRAALYFTIIIYFFMTRS